MKAALYGVIALMTGLTGYITWQFGSDGDACHEKVVSAATAEYPRPNAEKQREAAMAAAQNSPECRRSSSTAKVVKALTR